MHRRLEDETAHDVTDEVRQAGLGHTVAGYEVACALLAERAPQLSSLQRKTIAGHLNRSAGSTR